MYIRIIVFVISLSIVTGTFAQDSAADRIWVNEAVRRIADQYGLTVIAEAPSDLDLSAFKQAVEQIALMRQAAVADPNLLPDVPEEVPLQSLQNTSMSGSSAFLFVRCSKTHYIPAGSKTIKFKASAWYTSSPRTFYRIDDSVYWVEGTTVGGLIAYSHVQPKSWINQGGKKANVSATFTVTMSAGGIADTSFKDSCRGSKSF